MAISRSSGWTVVLAFAAAVLVLPAPASAHGPAGLIAPPRACPGQLDASAPSAQQERTMRCMTEYARHREGMGRFRDAPSLDRAARRKSADIVRCGEFSHEACGRPFTHWMRRVGYLRGPCWRAGENIALGNGPYGTVRAIFAGWIDSAPHRRTILGSFDDFGVGLHVGSVAGFAGAHVWTQEFGSLC